MHSVCHPFVDQTCDYHVTYYKVRAPELNRVIARLADGSARITQATGRACWIPEGWKDLGPFPLLDTDGPYRAYSDERGYVWLSEESPLPGPHRAWGLDISFRWATDGTSADFHRDTLYQLSHVSPSAAKRALSAHVMHRAMTYVMTGAQAKQELCEMLGDDEGADMYRAQRHTLHGEMLYLRDLTLADLNPHVRARIEGADT